MEVVQCALEVFGRKVARCSGTFFSFQLPIPAENHHLSRDDHLSKVGILACARIVRLHKIRHQFVLCNNVIFLIRDGDLPIQHFIVHKKYIILIDNWLDVCDCSDIPNIASRCYFIGIVWLNLISEWHCYHKAWEYSTSRNMIGCVATITAHQLNTLF